MRTLLLFFALTCSALVSQSQSIEGLYFNKWEAASGESIQYDLNLLKDGHFTFHSTRSYRSNLPDTLVEANGTWNLEGHLLVLKTTADDEVENDLQTNLNNTKARFISISPRNPDFNLVNPSLKFYKSKVFYTKDMELIKTESSITSSE